MNLVRHVRRGAAAVLALVFLAPLAAADDAASYFALTNGGRIVRASGTRWVTLETDTNIRFIHAARSTLYKVLKDGTIMAKNVGRNGASFSQFQWQSLGRDANVTARGHLSGGDNLLSGWVGGDFYFSAPLFKLSAGTVYMWNGTRWISKGAGAVLSGSVKLASIGTTGNMQWILGGTLSSKLVGRVTHRGGLETDAHFYFELTNGRLPYNLMGAEGGGTPVLVWTVNAAGNGEYVGKWSSDFATIYAGWGIDNEDNDKKEDVWSFNIRNGRWQFVMSDYIRGLSAANWGDEVGVLMDDGVGTVQTYQCFSDPCTVRVIPPPSGHVVTQLTGITITTAEDD